MTKRALVGAARAWLLLALASCGATVPVPVREIPRTSQCACRVLCAPDGYWWTLTWSEPGTTEGGRCTCIGAARRMGE